MIHRGRPRRRSIMPEFFHGVDVRRRGGAYRRQPPALFKAVERQAVSRLIRGGQTSLEDRR